MLFRSNIAPVTLAGGTTYWVSIVNATSGIPGWAWAYAPTGITHAAWSGGSWGEFGARNLAFRLTGAEAPTATESGTWGGIKALYR